MSMLQDVSVGMKEHGMYLKSLGVTGSYMVPRWKFFEEIAENIPAETGVILELGAGTGRLMDVVIRQKKLLADGGLCIAVDCNTESMDFIRGNRPHLVADPRVHLITDFAQNIEPELTKLLNGRKIDVTVVSIPHTFLSWPDVDRIWKIVTGLSTESGIGILYNVTRRRTVMQQHWKTVRTYDTCCAHYGLPPEFEVNIGVGPLSSRVAQHPSERVRGVSRDEVNIGVGPVLR